MLFTISFITRLIVPYNLCCFILQLVWSLCECMCICFVVFFFGVWFVLFVSIVTSFTRWRCVCYFSYLYFIVSIFFFLFIRSNIITLIYLYLVCIHAVAAHRTSVQMPMDTVHTQATHTNTHAHELLAVVLLHTRMR